MGLSVLRDLLALDDLEAIPLEELGPTTGFKGDHLTVDLSDPFAPEVVEIAVHEARDLGKSLRLGEHVEMEVGATARSDRHLSPGVAQDPADEVAGRPVIEGVLCHAPGKEVQVVEEIEQLLTEGAVGAEKVPFDSAVLHHHKGGLGLDVGVITCQVIGKEFAILKDGIDRLAQEPGFTAKITHSLPVRGLVGTYHDLLRGDGSPG